MGGVRLVDNGVGSGYRESHAAPGKGRQYDMHYATDPWDGFLWERERYLLQRILDRWFKGRSSETLDFGCGTGRLSAFFEGKVSSLTAVDVSESMLAEARAKLNHATVVCADITRDETVLGDATFDLIVAFRFFVNAEPRLRDDAIHALAGRLRDDGILVFNVHHHLGSPYVRLVRWSESRRGQVYNAMSLKDIRRLVAAAGLRVERVFPAGIIRIPKVKLPWAVNRMLDRALWRVPGAHLIAEDLVVVAVRA